jgi:hypothetical protein
MTTNYIALAMDKAIRAWQGDPKALETVRQAAEQVGYEVQDDDLMEMMSHSPFLEALAWGLKELDAEAALKGLDAETAVRN